MMFIAHLISSSVGVYERLCFLVVTFPVCSRTLIVCVEVLRPSQTNGVMSSAVSLSNHTFTGQT